MKKLLSFCFLLVATSVSGCAVNRVEQVNTKEDMNSFYKVPVVFGEGVAGDSLPLKRMDDSTLSFMEYDAGSKTGSGGCLGTADSIWLGAPQDAGKVRYSVIMVPPGDYALSMSHVVPAEAAPSVYFTVRSDKPQYLGNFIFKKIERRDTDLKRVSPYEVVLLPIQYDNKAASEKLASLGVIVQSLPEIPMRPTDGYAEFFLCAP